MSASTKKQRTQRITDFLLTFFPLPHTTYMHIDVHGYVLVRYFPHHNLENPRVMIYTLESFSKSTSTYQTTIREAQGSASIPV